tara:strand:+ start:2789 stop:3130 length:342 start_codon:yes stop_codon:yes gene_type:complete
MTHRENDFPPKNRIETLDYTFRWGAVNSPNQHPLDAVEDFADEVYSTIVKYSLECERREISVGTHISFNGTDILRDLGDRYLIDRHERGEDGLDHRWTGIMDLKHKPVILVSQ